MRICKCGGIVRQHPLTNNREAWTCNSCGRYEAIQRGAPEQDAAVKINVDSMGKCGNNPTHTN